MAAQEILPRSSYWQPHKLPKWNATQPSCDAVKNKYGALIQIKKSDWRMSSEFWCVVAIPYCTSELTMKLYEYTVILQNTRNLEGSRIYHARSAHSSHTASSCTTGTVILLFSFCVACFCKQTSNKEKWNQSSSSTESNSSHIRFLYCFATEARWTTTPRSL